MIDKAGELPTWRADAAAPADQPICPSCGRVCSRREKAEQGVCNDCYGGPYAEDRLPADGAGG